MAKKNKFKQASKGSFSRSLHLGFVLPERAGRLILSVVMFSLALIFSFAFFEKAGTAGKLLFGFSWMLLGKEVFLLPLFFVITALVLWGMRTYRITLVLFNLLLLILGVSGVLGAIARFQRADIGEMSGWVGFGVSWPLFSAFGFWVAEIIFGAVVLISGIIFWQLLPHEKPAKPHFVQGAQEKIRKIFAPKFEVHEVEPEPKVREVPVLDSIPSAKEKPQADALLEDYKHPPAELLELEKGLPNAGDIKTYSAIIKKTLQNFDIPVEISEVNIGPTVTQYAFKPAEGIKLSRITALQNDLALALAAHPLRIEAPIPGRALVGVEVPNKTRAIVRLRSLVEHSPFKESSCPLLLALGKDVAGVPMYADLTKMPHLLVAGATGSGKTIALNNIILSLLYRNSPSILRFILVDPKRVEFPVYDQLPHLLCPVIFDTQRALNALKWLIREMERRFQVLSEARVRDVGSYHVLMREQKAKNRIDEFEDIPYIVTIIDELADLMAVRGKELEAMIVRLAQMARAVGIHLVLATQRPSVEVLTGLIKANITSRVAFQVASQVDSRTILDGAGAEKLLGRGDMLFVSSEFQKPRRIQGAYISEKEVKKVVEWIDKETKGVMRQDFQEDDLSQSAAEGLEGGALEEGEEDPLYEDAKRVVIESRRASASLLQRRLKVGYARAARLLDILQERGVVGPGEGAKPREVYVSREKEEQEWINP